MSSGLWIPGQESRWTIGQYYAVHVSCPCCRRTDVKHVCQVKFPESGFMKDDSAARCNCGWSGTVHDLLPQQPNVVLEKHDEFKKAASGHYLWNGLTVQNLRDIADELERLTGPWWLNDPVGWGNGGWSVPENIPATIIPNRKLAE